MKAQRAIDEFFANHGSLHSPWSSSDNHYLAIISPSPTCLKKKRATPSSLAGIHQTPCSKLRYSVVSCWRSMIKCNLFVSFFYLILVTAIISRSGLKTFYRGGWGKRSCPRSATASHSMAVDRTRNLPIERQRHSALSPPQTVEYQKCYSCPGPD